MVGIREKIGFAVLALIILGGSGYILSTLYIQPFIFEDPPGENDPPDVIDLPDPPEDNGKLRSLIIQSNADFVVYDLPGNGSVENPYVIDGGTEEYTNYKIKISGTTVHIVIQNCSFIGSGGSLDDGITLEDIELGGINITGNEFNNNFRGISLRTYVNLHITNNNFRDNGFAGVASYYSKNLHLTNNRFYNSGLHIMSVTNYLDTITIEDNYVNDKKLGYFGNTDNITITCNQEYGQLVFIGCNNIYISDIDIQNTNEGILCIYSSNITITRSSISGCIHGIQFMVCSEINILNNTIDENREGFSCAASNGVIKDNIISINMYGLRLSNSHSLLVTGNKIHNNSNFAMYLFRSSNNVITDNRLESSGIGLKLTDYSDNNLIHHNVFNQNTNQAEDNCQGNIWYDSNTLHGNFWSDFNGGVYLIPGTADSVDPYPHSIDDFY